MVNTTTTRQPVAKCEVRTLRTKVADKNLQFTPGQTFELVCSDDLKLSNACKDLLDLAAAVFWVEHAIGNPAPSSPPVEFSLTLPVREPSRWTTEVVTLATQILGTMGNASWQLRIVGGVPPVKICENSPYDASIDQVFLFSGGLDSFCGAAMLPKTVKKRALPVSFYQRKGKGLQRELADFLGLNAPSTWTLRSNKVNEPGRRFQYRSFLFLTIATCLANSLGARKVIQFENGPLALAVPPDVGWILTRHAHPKIHQLASSFFASYFRSQIEIVNPMLLKTKFEAVQSALKKGERFSEKITRTQSCWFHHSNVILGGKKKSPNTSCGVCIPCIVRRTALRDDAYAFDLIDNKTKNDPHLGRNFRAYHKFLAEVNGTDFSNEDFLIRSPFHTQSVLLEGMPITLSQATRLYKKFASEFAETFNLNL